MYYKPTKFNQSRWSYMGWGISHGNYFISWICERITNVYVSCGMSAGIVSTHVVITLSFRLYMSHFPTGLVSSKKKIVAMTFAPTYIFLRKSKYLNFFLCELTLILGLGEKLKKEVRDICKRTLYIEFERDRSISLGSTIGDGQTHRQTQTHTHTFFFLKHVCRMWE